MSGIKIVRDSDGTCSWYDDDQPAVVHCDNGQRHRDDVPACIENIGSQYWYKHGILHRDGDLPAVVFFLE